MDVIYEKWTNGEKIMGSGADKEWEDTDLYKQGTAYARAVRDNAKAMLDNPLKKQEGGNHYKDMAIQPVEFITANNLGFLEGNVVKYICRHHAKNGAEDIKKAIHYCELLLQTKYGEK